MLCWLITFCTIARLWIVISWFVWMLWTREEVSLTDSAGIRERERERGTEGGSESERLGWHSRFANENEGRGRKWVWTTRSHSRTRTRDGGGSESERLVLIRDSRTRTRGGGRKWVWTTHWIIHRKHDWTNERTNERTTLFGELNDANWFAETNHEIHHEHSPRIRRKSGGGGGGGSNFKPPTAPPPPSCLGPGSGPGPGAPRWD